MRMLSFSYYKLDKHRSEQSALILSVEGFLTIDKSETMIIAFKDSLHSLSQSMGCLMSMSHSAGWASIGIENRTIIYRIAI